MYSTAISKPVKHWIRWPNPDLTLASLARAGWHFQFPGYGLPIHPFVSVSRYLIQSRSHTCTRARFTWVRSPAPFLVPVSVVTIRDRDITPLLFHSSERKLVLSSACLLVRRRWDIYHGGNVNYFYTADIQNEGTAVVRTSMR